MKWYKNYVEFYRFQPGQTPASQDSQQQQQLSFGTRQEFELEGINLNVSNERQHILPELPIKRLRHRINAQVAESSQVVRGDGKLSERRPPPEDFDQAQPGGAGAKWLPARAPDRLDRGARRSN